MANIELENISLVYPIYGVKARSLKTSLINMAVGGSLNNQGGSVKVKALKDINLNLQDGDRVGLIGHNGAGKTSLLKVLAQIYEPTQGTIRISGQTSCLFDIMMGMDQELTGYENVMLRGLILGLSKQEIKKITPDIEAFAELGDFMKMPIRTYSSGMMVRLAFGIVTSVFSDILLIDEVVNVGDASFVEKAKARMVSLIHRSDIMILSTHDHQLIREFCNKVIWLEQGHVSFFGSIDEAFARNAIAVPVVEAENNVFYRSLNRMILQKAKILVTGSGGLVGSAVIDELKRQGYFNLFLLTRQSCDLTNFEAVKILFHEIKPDVVFHAAASVYGIGGNMKNQASVFFDNILINTHVIEASRQTEVAKIIAMGTVAAYPEPEVIPVREDHIWNGPPHRSESSYGHAKRAMLAQLLAYQDSYGLDYAYVISTNLYGPNDKFDIQNGHVIPSLIRKFYEAKKNNSEAVIWGDGTAERDFLYSKDMARALVLIMNQYSGPINVASGVRVRIKDIAQILSDYLEINENIVWDNQMPNGREFCDIDLTCLNSIGFKAEYNIETGIKESVDWFVDKYEQNLIRC